MAAMGFQTISPENYQRKIAVGCIVVMVGLYAIAYLDVRRMFLFRFLSPVLVWALYDCFPAKWTLLKFQEKKWMRGLFFIYCTHFFIINTLTPFSYIDTGEMSERYFGDIN